MLANMIPSSLPVRFPSGGGRKYQRFAALVQETANSNQLATARVYRFEGGLYSESLEFVQMADNNSGGMLKGERYEVFKAIGFATPWVCRAGSRTTIGIYQGAGLYLNANGDYFAAAPMYQFPWSVEAATLQVGQLVAFSWSLYGWTPVAAACEALP